MLPPRLRNITVQKNIIPAVRLENHVEQISDEGRGAKQPLDTDIEHHACDTDTRNSKLKRPIHDVERDQRVHDVADAEE